MNIVKKAGSILVIPISYLIAVLLCTVLMVYVPRWLAYVCACGFPAMGVGTVLLSNRISEPTGKRFLIAGIVILLTCAMGILFGGSYRDAVIALYGLPFLFSTEYLP